MRPPGIKRPRYGDRRQKIADIDRKTAVAEHPFEQVFVVLVKQVSDIGRHAGLDATGPDGEQLPTPQANPAAPSKTASAR